MKHFRKSLSAILVTAAIAASVFVPAMAAGAYTPIAGPTTNFSKYLVLDAEATVPNVTMTFTLAAGSPVAASAGKIPVYAGNDAARVALKTGATSQTVDAAIAAAVGTAVFAPTDNNTAVSGGITKTVSTTDSTTTIAADSDTSKKHVVKTVDINLSELTFSEPGVYRYVLEENNPSDTAVSKDTTKKTLDVYVQDATTTSGKALEIAGCVMYNGTISTAPTAGATAAKAALGTKDNTFVNNYDSYNLTVSKTVTGNQGSRDEYFKITVVLDGVVSGNTYTVDITHADNPTSTNAINTEPHNNPSSLTSTSTSLSQDFWLQSGQSIVIQGIGKGVSYTVTEDYATASAEGYSVSAEVTGDTTDVTNSAASDGSVTDTSLEADTAVAYTNDKQGVIPTGVLLSATPVIIVGVVVIAGIVFLAVRSAKRKAMEAAEAEADSEQ